MKKQQKTIGIDARLYGPKSKGLGRYTQEVVDRVTEIDKDHKYVIFLAPHNYEEFIVNNENVKKVLVRARWYTLKEQLVLPYYIWKERIDLMHVPHFNAPIFCPSKLVVTIHDLILTKYPSQRASTLAPWLYKIKNLFYKILIKLVLWRAKKIIAVSEYTRQDIVKQFGIKKEKIIVTYEGVAREINCPSGQDRLLILKKYNISKPFVMYVGSAYPHKNLESLIDVVSSIQKDRRELSLVLVGGEDYFYKRLKKKVRDKDLSGIIFAGFVLDEDLAVLYKEARAYVFPSLYEGFGLPPLEAMAMGCAVVSSDKSCLPEVLGSAALYFDPENKEDMRQQIKRIVSDQELRERLISKGREQYKKYSWQDCARKTLWVYKKFL